jgi:hypothetical protein
MADWLANSPRIRLRKSSVLRDATGLQMIATLDQVARSGWLGDDNRTSALLILASSVDPDLASTCHCVVLSSNDPQPHDQAQQRGREAGGLVSSDAVGP